MSLATGVDIASVCHVAPEAYTFGTRLKQFSSVRTKQQQFLRSRNKKTLYEDKVNR